MLRHATRSTGLLLKALPRLSREASGVWIDDNAPRLGAAVAFYTLLSLAPIIVIAVAAAGTVFGQNAAQGRLASEIQDIAGPAVALRIERIVRGAYQPRTSLIATALGVTTLLFGATSVFVELREAMNTIWHVSLPQDRNHAAMAIRLIRDRFYSFATVLVTGVLLLLSLVWSAVIKSIGIALPPAAMFVVLCFLVAVLFAALYKILPEVALKWSDVSLGAIITSLLFMFGKQLMGLYFASTAFGSTYGAAGSPIVVLLWVYYSAQLFFWGAEFSKVYTKTLGSQRGLFRSATGS